jgi:hypothetical protein
VHVVRIVLLILRQILALRVARILLLPLRRVPGLGA